MKILYLLISLNALAQANILLQKPRVISSADMADIEASVKKSDIVFTWTLNKATKCTYFYADEKPGFVVWLCGLPVCFHGFASYTNLKRSFAKIKDKLLHGGQQNRNDYFFKKPLKFADANPMCLQFSALCNLLKDKTFVFYTGAGLSAAGNIPTMPVLEKKLKVDRSAKFLLKAAITDPQSLATAFADFCRLAMNGQPTPAHFALSQIAQARNICILTENIDLLQQRAGCVSIPIHSDVVYQAETKDFLAVDYLVCVGLSHDDCGFIAHYKAENPHGKIIALDFNVPNYLSNEDYVMQDDLQIVLPLLAQALCR